MFLQVGRGFLVGNLLIHNDFVSKSLSVSRFGLAVRR